MDLQGTPSNHGLQPIRRILLGVDLSERTPNLIKFTLELANAFNSNVVVCNVVMMETGFPANEKDGYPVDDREGQILDAVRRMVFEVAGTGAADRMEIKMLHGDPAERLVEYAEYSGCDLIVVGSRGLGGLKKAILGSVSSAVAAKSKKSVLIFR